MLLDDDIREEVKEIFQIEVTKPIKIILYSNDDSNSKLAEDLLKELSQLNKNISYCVNKDKKRTYYPIFQINNIEFAGIPDGDKFSLFINIILMIANKDNQIINFDIDKDLDGKITTYITSDCLYCASLQEKICKLQVNTKIKYEIINLSYFKDKTKIKTVPYTIINEQYSVVGNVPLNMIIEKLK